MSIESGIQARWEQYEPLNRLLDVARVFAGDVHGGGLPFATIKRTGGDTERTSESLWEYAEYAFEVVAETAAECQAIDRAMLPAFNKAEFDAGDGLTVLDMRPGGKSEEQDSSKAWHVKRAFKVTSRQRVETML